MLLPAARSSQSDGAAAPKPASSSSVGRSSSSSDDVSTGPSVTIVRRVRTSSSLSAVTAPLSGDADDGFTWVPERTVSLGAAFPAKIVDLCAPEHSGRPTLLVASSYSSVVARVALDARAHDDKAEDAAVVEILHDEAAHGPPRSSNNGPAGGATNLVSSANNARVRGLVAVDTGAHAPGGLVVALVAAAHVDDSSGVTTPRGDSSSRATSLSAHKNANTAPVDATLVVVAPGGQRRNGSPVSDAGSGIIDDDDDTARRPPRGGRRVTAADLDALRAHFDARLDTLEAKLDRLIGAALGAPPRG
mmetsp:Transcript_1450/g.5627  ORF Transcript_1450/g.5627 Transcript_1450/m.5627 type:complete len:304 (+) Transcript_1450:833-1744(+)